MADARWVAEFDERTQECIDAAASLPAPALGHENEPRPPLSWQFYRDGSWPDDYPTSRKEPPEKIFDPELHDERTLKEPRVSRRSTRLR